MKYVLKSLALASILACSLTARAQITSILEAVPAWAGAIQTAGPQSWSAPPPTIVIDGHPFTEQLPNQPSFTLGGGWIGEVFFNGGAIDTPMSIGFQSGAQSGIFWAPATAASKPFGFQVASVSGAPAPFAFTFIANSVTALQGDDSKVALYTYAPSLSELWVYAAYKISASSFITPPQVFGRFTAIPEPRIFALLMGLAALAGVLFWKKRQLA